MSEINNKKKIDELLNLVKDLKNKEFECKRCKEKTDLNPFSWEYFKKNLFTKKYFVDSIWKTIIKTILIAILVILLNDRWYEFTDKLRVLFPWNDLWRKFPKK